MEDGRYEGVEPIRFDEEGGSLDQNVILVPADYRRAFVLDCDPTTIRIQGSCGDSWAVPSQREIKLLMRFVNEADIKLVRSMQLIPGTRMGYDKRGVYIHEDHHKRYFGLLRSAAHFVLKEAVTEAVPRTVFCKGADRDTQDNLLGSLLRNLPAVSDEARENMLRATFRSVDTSRDGVLSRQEVVSMVRKILPTMSGEDIVQLWQDVDTNEDGHCDYEEFITWMTKNAPERISSALGKQLHTQSDCVMAVFRVWDKSGDGVITKRELGNVLRKTCPELTLPQIKSLMLHLDVNKDDVIDYDEFVRFLFDPS
eukprot:TRINITY_DN44280_c0_g1_i1.p1 TRINITY_DN44280_c0_g1~~TRINITY_DN44280_c0_g1_i1.p1  ORF type:complete len:311 (-),score=56.27 TRINITY_DN44280_c0_g1_i1:45-977(-)